MLDPVLKNPWVRAVALAACIVGVIILAYLLRPVLIPLLIALTVAYILDPVVDFFERHKIRRTIGIAILGAVVVFVFLSIPIFAVPNLVSEARELARAAAQRSEAPEAGEDRLVDTIVDWLPLHELVIAMGWAPPVEEPSEEAVDQPVPEEAAEAPPEEAVDQPVPEEAAEAPPEETEMAKPEPEPVEEPEDVEIAHDFDAVAILSKRIADYVEENAVALLRANAPRLVETGQQMGVSIGQVFSTIGRNLVAFILFIANFALFAFVAVYLLKDFDTVVASAGDLIPPRNRAKTFDIVRKIDHQLRAFMRGQVLVMFCLGVMYAVGLSIARVPFAIPIGLMGGLASFVPYLGLALTIGPAVLLTLLQHGIDWHIAVCLLTFLVAQTLEGTVLTPTIVGDQVGLGPVWVILAIMVFSTALGFLGLLLAVPFAATLKVLVLEGLAYYRTSPIFAGAESDSSSSE